jgi:hypothetical protein
MTSDSWSRDYYPSWAFETANAVVARDAINYFRTAPKRSIVLLRGAERRDLRIYRILIGPAFVLSYQESDDPTQTGIVIVRHPSMRQRLSEGLPTLDGFIYVDLLDWPQWLDDASTSGLWQLEYDDGMERDGVIGVRTRPIA